MCEEERIFSKIFNMFVQTSGFQKSLAHTDFNMFVDDWTSANESSTQSYYSSPNSRIDFSNTLYS